MQANRGSDCVFHLMGRAMAQTKILVADDEPHILHIVSLKLCNAGYNVITARDGREAFDLVIAERPSLLITDFHMPELNGLELCRKMRADSSIPAIPVIMLTARGYNLEQSDMTESGIQLMISKPFSPRRLLTTVTEVLQQAA